jgi:hypothetical protein
MREIMKDVLIPVETRLGHLHCPYHGLQHPPNSEDGRSAIVERYENCERLAEKGDAASSVHYYSFVQKQ